MPRGSHTTAPAPPRRRRRRRRRRRPVRRNRACRHHNTDFLIRRCGENARTRAQPEGAVDIADLRRRRNTRPPPQAMAEGRIVPPTTQTLQFYAIFSRQGAAPMRTDDVDHGTQRRGRGARRSCASNAISKSSWRVPGGENFAETRRQLAQPMRTAQSLL